jgi:hypothetical protein
MSLALAGVRAALTPKWVSDDLWKRAGQVPAFDLDFTRQSIVDRIAGITPTYTRPSSEKRLWNGAAFQTYAADVPGFELRNGIWEYVHEPAATNVCVRSGTIASTGWSVGANLTLESSVVPLGTLNGDRLTRIANTTNNIRSIASTLAAGQCTFSVICSSNGPGQQIGIRLQPAFANRADAVFDLAAGTVRGSAGVGTATGVSAAIRSLGGGIFLCSLTATVDANPAIIIAPTDSTTSIGGFEGASAVLSSVTIYHVQLETGPVATSPIVTTGSAVTRNADVMSITGTPAADLIARLGSSYWAYVEGTTVSGVSGSAFISADDNTNNERWRLGHNSSSSGQAITVDGGTVTANNLNSGGSWPLGAYRKAVGAFAQDNVRLALTGQPLIADTSATLPTVTQFKIGAAQAVTTVPGLFIRRIALFPGIPSDALLNTMVV